MSMLFLQLGSTRDLRVVTDSRLQDLENDPSLRALLSGSIRLELEASPVTLQAADLNAAAADSFFTRMRCFLRSTPPAANVGTLLRHVDLDPVITVNETIVDVDVAAPTVVGTANFNGGVLDVQLLWDTDANATKTYANGDQVTVDIQVSATDELLGYSVPMVTMTYDIV